MKQKSTLRTVTGIIVLVVIVFAKLPRYHTFREKDFDIEVNAYYTYEIESSASSEVRVKLNSSNGNFDAYLVDESQMKIVEQWMQSEDTVQPVFDTIAKWENTNSVERKGIVVPKGLFYLVMDNSSLGPAVSDSNVLVSMELAEKY